MRCLLVEHRGQSSWDAQRTVTSAWRVFSTAASIIDNVLRCTTDKSVSPTRWLHACAVELWCGGWPMNCTRRCLHDRITQTLFSEIYVTSAFTNRPKLCQFPRMLHKKKYRGSHKIVLQLYLYLCSRFCIIQVPLWNIEENAVGVLFDDVIDVHSRPGAICWEYLAFRWIYVHHGRPEMPSCYLQGEVATWNKVFITSKTYQIRGISSWMLNEVGVMLLQCRIASHVDAWVGHFKPKL